MDSGSETTGDWNHHSQDMSPEANKKEENIEVYSQQFSDEYFNFNAHVDELILSLEDETKKAKRIVSQKGIRRFRKTKEQTKILTMRFEQYKQWDNELQQEIAIESGLSKSQVYKWYWEQMKGKKQ